MIQPPCRDCEARTIGCHCSCEKYKAFRAKMDKFREAADERARTNAMFQDVMRPERRLWNSAKRQRNDITKNRK